MSIHGIRNRISITTQGGNTMLSMTRWNPFEELGTLHRDMDRVFGRYIGSDEPTSGPAWTPATEVRTGDDGWKVRMALPGIDPSDVHVDLHGGSLTISGERTRTEKDAGGYASEIHYGRFERAFTLPAKVDAEKVSAHYENGMLELTLPLAETARPRRIAIGTTTPVAGVTAESVAS